MSKAPLISIVDDDALARDGICELVESLGYEATTFESAEEFLKSSMVAETTCLISDVQMPGLSGLELQETLQSQGYQMPVILITAYPSEKNRTRALDKGALSFLSKPFDEASLIKCLTTAITTRARAAKGFITLGSTTSMQDSGLLDHILPLFKAASGIDVLQALRCGETGKRLWRSAEVDHRVPLFRVWTEHRDLPWPTLLEFWGLPNLQLINRDVHAAKCAGEARDRRAARLLETELS